MSPALRRHGVNIAIVILAVVGALVVYVVDRGSVTTTERVARSKHLLAAFRDDDVSEVVVTMHGRVARLFRGPEDRAGQRPWRVEIDHATYPAEEPLVDQYLAALRDGTVDHRLTGGAENTGEARGMIAVQMGRQRFLVTLRGAAPAPPGAVYAEVSGGEEPAMSVISAPLAAVLDVAPEAFRDKTLVSLGAADVTALSLDGDGGSRRLVKAPWPAPGGGAFRFDGSTADGDVRVSAPALDKVWDAVGKLRADSFLSDADADAALVRRVTVTLTPKSGAPVVVDVGGACPGHPDDVVAVLRGERRVSACVARGVLEGLAVPADELVDRRLVGAEAEEVMDLKLASGAITLAMARTGGQWHQQTPVDRMVAADVGRPYLDRLLEVSARKLVTGAPQALGLDPPRATVRVVSLVPAAGDAGDAERTELLEVGAEQDGVVHVRRVEDGAVAELSAEAASALLPNEIALRPKKVYAVSFASVRAVRVEGSGRTQRFERQADGTWSLLSPKGEGLAPDQGFLGDLGEAVGGLTVDRWVGPARPEHGLDQPRLSVELDVRDEGTERRTIKVALGAPAGASGSFARTGDDPTVFVATRKLEAAADRWLLDRTALVVDPAQVTRLTLAGSDGKLSIEASDGAFRVVGADPAASAHAAAVREALSDMVAEVAVSVGPAGKRQGLDKPLLVVTGEVAGKPLRLRFGAGDVVKGMRVYHVRRDGVDATYGVAQARVRPLLEAVGIASEP